MNTRIIAVANHKGGVGKTTTVASLGSILSKKGYKLTLTRRPISPTRSPP